MSGSKSYHITGIGGVGMSGLALLLKQAGNTVWGTDLRQSPITEGLSKQSLRIAYEPQPCWLAKADVHCVPVGLPSNHPEVLAAAKYGIPTQSRNEALGHFLQDNTQEVVAVFGSLARALSAKALGLVLQDTANWGYCIGALSRANDSHAQWGRHMVIEWDEREDFTHYLPSTCNDMVISDWQHEHYQYYAEDDLLPSLLTKAQKKGLTCIYPTREAAYNLDFEVLYAEKSETYAFDLHYKLGQFTITLKGQEVDGSFSMQGGQSEASAIASCITYAMHKGIPYPNILKRLKQITPRLQFIAWLESYGSWFHDIRMHPLSINQSYANLSMASERPIHLVFKPYAPTLRLYDGVTWAKVLRKFSKVFVLPPYEGMTDSDFTQFHTTMNQEGVNLEIVSQDEAHHRMQSPCNALWLWVGANDILPSTAA